MKKEKPVNAYAIIYVCALFAAIVIKIVEYLNRYLLTTQIIGLVNHCQ